VRIAQPVDALPDLAHELAGLIELENLRRRVAIERRVRAALMVEDDDMTLRVDSDTEHLAKVHVRRDLEEVGRRVERDNRHAGARRRLCGHASQREQHRSCRRDESINAPH